MKMNRMMKEDQSMKTKSKISGYILRTSTAALLFSCVIIAISSALNLPNHPPKISVPPNDTDFGVKRTRQRAVRGCAYNPKQPNADVRGSRRVSTGYRRSLLASSHLAKRERRIPSRRWMQ